MSILGMNGFESFAFASNNTDASAMDKVVILNGSPVYTTAANRIPDDSPSAASLEIAYQAILSFPWLNDAAGTRNEPAGTFWLHFRSAWDFNNNSNDTSYIGLSSNDQEYVTISRQDTTSYVTLRVAGSVVAVSSYSVSLDFFDRIMVEFAFTGGSPVGGDTIKVYKDGVITPGSEIINHTLSGPQAAALASIGSGRANGFFARSTGFGAWLDDIWAMDTSVATGATDPAQFKDGGIRGAVATGDGSPTNWTLSTGVNSYAVIDDVSGTDNMSASAVGTETQVTKAAISTVAEKVAAVKVYANVTQSDASAGTRVGLGFDDGVTSVQKDSIVPATGYVTNVYNERSAGVDWTPGNYDGADIKIISVA